MTMMKELAIAKDAVRKASMLAHRVARHHVASINKDDNSPVTVADFGAQAVIISAIHAAFPDDPIVGEEDAEKLRENKRLAGHVLELARKAAPDDTRFATDDTSGMCEAIDLGGYEGGSKGRQWALDPVDGTKGFLRGGQYAVCLALIVDSVVEVGVIGCPNLGPHGELYSAVRGMGSFCEPLVIPKDVKDLSPEPRRIHFRSIDSTADAVFCESVEGGHSDLGTQAAIARALGITQSPVRMDSQAKYCTIAKGAADIYLRLPVSLSYQEKIWDHAAGNVIVTEAGGVVTDMYGAPLDFGQGRTLKNNKGVIASSPVVHRRILAVLASEQ